MVTEKKNLGEGQRGNLRKLGLAIRMSLGPEWTETLSWARHVFSWKSRYHGEGGPSFIAGSLRA